MSQSKISRTSQAKKVELKRKQNKTNLCYFLKKNGNFIVKLEEEQNALARVYIQTGGGNFFATKQNKKIVLCSKKFSFAINF